MTAWNMWAKFKSWIFSINGISLFGFGLSRESKTNSSKVATFRKSICLTSQENDEFISFLENNDHKIVFLDTDIDASVSTREQWEIAEKENVNIEPGTFNGVPLTLPNKDGDIVTVTFYFSDGRIFHSSHGGTGIHTIYINGLFEISRTLHGGPTRAFHLNEIKASLENKIDMHNR